MKVSIWIVTAAALIGLGLVLVLGRTVFWPEQSLILSAGFNTSEITPNADGDNDIALFSYELSRNATVTLLLENAEGRPFVFRDAEPRIPQEYTVPFSGVVDGFEEPGESFAGTIERRLVPDGNYTWRLFAEDMASGEIAEASGTFTVTSADVALPEISSFTVGPEIFTPNRDGVDDRVQINLYLEKDVEMLRVYLVDEAGREYPISARVEARQEREAGRHIFDYEAGIDLGAEPPPDGAYRIIAEAQDAVGQRMQREAALVIENGGPPRAEIANQPTGVDVVFATMPYEGRYNSDLSGMGDLVPPPPEDPQLLAPTMVTMQVGDLLVFKLTVENYGSVPIRTIGPWPGTVYQEDQLPASMGEVEAAGAWRVGIECRTSATSYPYRWAVGDLDTLEAVYDPVRDETFYYLPAGERTVVWGAIRLQEINPRANPLPCWAGLIHEGVEVVNRVVGPRDIMLVDPSGETSQ